MKKILLILGLLSLHLGVRTVAQTPAPDFKPSGEWFNSDALSILDLQDQVILVEIWTFGCYNCYRSIPALRNFYDSYHNQGFEIIGVHTPEFDYEKVSANVQAALEKHEVSWPVFQDNEFKTWRAYNSKAWPTFYLIDKEGNIRYTHRGEISDKFPRGIEPLENAIKELLAERL